MSNRFDLTRWVTHFVHARNPDNDPNQILEEGNHIRFPYHVDGETNERFDVWHDYDREYPIEPDGTAHQVLLKILDDGHIRATWSFRNGRPAIYGHSAAVCLTEMPLGALLEYAKERPHAVSPYAISVLRHEAFAAGARPVIYGCTMPHSERNTGGFWRELDESCGIAVHEQCRYVATWLNGVRPVDWTHEREWRWRDSKQACSVPGLPIWLKDEPRFFSQVLLIVPALDDVKRILKKLKELSDAGSHDWGHEYNRATLAKTRVVCLEELSATEGVLRLEDVPSHSIRAVTTPTVPDDMRRKARQVAASARAAAVAAATEWADRNTDRRGLFGFATVVMDVPETSAGQALLETGEASPIGGLCYFLRDVTRGASSTGLLDQEEAAAEAACAVLSQAFPDVTFWVHARLD